MRIVFTGGGTGGHVFPNIAIIHELKRLVMHDPRSWIREVFYIGEKNSFEEKICEQEHIPFYGISAGKFRRYFDIKNAIDMFKIPKGIFQAYRILKQLKPDVVFAKGGYVSFPVVMAVWFLKIPLWIHESDVTPGLATKIASRFAQKIWLSFEESGKFFPNKNAEAAGNPIRKEITQGTAEAGYRFTGFSKKLPVILIIGGSSGAQSLNELIFKILPGLLQEIQVIHITGMRDQRSGINHANYRAFEFLEKELAHCYAISDLVISRAGSGSIFEILAVNKPMLLVPLPSSASRGDQIENAAVFEKHGWAFSVDQDIITPKEFLEKIMLLLRDEKLRKCMIQDQKRAKGREAATKIVQALLAYFAEPVEARKAQVS